MPGITERLSELEKEIASNPTGMSLAKLGSICCSVVVQTIVSIYKNALPGKIQYALDTLDVLFTEEVGGDPVGKIMINLENLKPEPEVEGIEETDFAVKSMLFGFFKNLLDLEEAAQNERYDNLDLQIAVTRLALVIFYDAPALLLIAGPELKFFEDCRYLVFEWAEKALNELESGEA